MQTRGVEVRQATRADLDLLVPLFDAYRQFYRQPSDLDRARRFLLERFEHEQSVIFLAFEDAAAIGFTQLYPSFSSGAMARIFILNDLFVAPEARRCGAGSALLQAAAQYGRRVGALRLVLSTEITNTTAQSLYDRTGWKRDTVFCVYHLALSDGCLLTCSSVSMNAPVKDQEASRGQRGSKVGALSRTLRESSRVEHWA